jgi:hypothetical protein
VTRRSNTFRKPNHIRVNQNQTHHFEVDEVDTSSIAERHPIFDRFTRCMEFARRKAVLFFVRELRF